MTIDQKIASNNIYAEKVSERAPSPAKTGDGASFDGFGSAITRPADPNMPNIPKDLCKVVAEILGFLYKVDHDLGG